MKKTITALLLSMALLVGAASLPVQAATPAQELALFERLQSTLVNYFSGQYAYFDIDRDGTQELICCYEFGYSDVAYDIYLLKNNSVVKTDTISSNNGRALELFVPKSTGRLTMYYADMIQTVNLVNGKVSYSDSRSAAYGYDSSDTLRWTSTEVFRFPALTDVQKLYVKEIKAWCTAGEDRDVMLGDIDNDGWPDMVKQEIKWANYTFLHSFYIYHYVNGGFQMVGSKQGVFTQDGGALMVMNRDGGLLWYDGADYAEILRIRDGAIVSTPKALVTDDPFTEVLRASVPDVSIYGAYTEFPSDAELIPSRVPGTPYRLGDPDGDGNITASDARLALRRSVQLETYAKGTKQFTACDADRDGNVTASDARLILRTAVGLEELS